MDTAVEHPSPDILAKLNPLREFSRHQLELLARTLTIHSARKGEVLFKIGDAEDFSLYLLQGRVRLTSVDDRQSEISEDSPQSLQPIANLIPRRYEVKTLAPVNYLKVDNQLFKGLATSSAVGITSSEIDHQESPQNLDEAENLLSQTLSKDLEKDCLSLPTLPDIAFQVGQAISDETNNAHKLSRIIQTDPAITTKLIRAANSPLYGGVNKIDSCKDAIVRLGSDTTHKLVLTFALRELFYAHSGLLRGRMRQLWEHSIKVSAICFVLAKITRQFNPEHAMLVGLLHDIGEVAILTYAERFPTVLDNEEELNTVIQDMRGPIGAQILQTWGFTDDLVTVALEAEAWRRNPGGPADYTDLVIIAQLHCYIGKPRSAKLPMMHELPAFTKMDIGELTPKLSLKILEKADEKIARVESMLRS